MGVVVKVGGLLLILALVAVTIEAACTGDPIMGTGAQAVVVTAGEVVAIACDSPTPYVSDGDGRVYLSHCLDGTVWSPNTTDGITCAATSPSGAVYTFETCTGQPTLLENSELMSATVTSSGATLSHFMSCTTGNEWLSGASVHLSQCLNQAWTPVHDMCAEKCDVPRDCSEVSDLGFTDDTTYQVVPSGSIDGEAILVYCWLNSTNDMWSGGGWTMVSHQGAPLTAAVDNPDPSATTKYYIGIQHLKQLNLGLDQSERPQTMQIILLQSESVMVYADYQEVLIDHLTGDLKKVAKYMGNAGDALQHNLQIPYSDDFQWWYGVGISTPTSNASSMGFNGFAWPTIPPGTILPTTAIVRIRPTAYDQAITCPPIEGVMIPSWTLDQPSVTVSGEPTRIKIMEGLEMPLGRSEGAVINYTCYGIIDKETISGNSSGLVTCQKNADETFTWSEEIQMPCNASCPTNFVLAADGVSCYHFSQAPEPNGVVGAALRCSELDSSLAFIRKEMGFDDVVADTFYYTTHAMPSLSGAALHTDVVNLCDNSTGIICQETDNEQCAALTHRSYQFQNCSDDTTHYACMWPAYCPPDFQSYKGMCYMAAEFSGNAIAALEHCGMFGAFLAYPLDTGTLQFLDGLVRELATNGNQTGDIDATDAVIGLNNIVGGDWTLGGLYVVSSDVTDMATGPNPYYALYVPETVDGNLSLTSIPMSRDDLTVALCQFPGFIKCNDKPPAPLADMIQVWDNSTDVAATVTYSCSPGYFLDSNTSVSEQNVECRGQLGGWFPAELKECIKIEVCNDTILPEFDNMEPVFDATTYMYLNGSLNYTCPEGMATTPNITFQVVTCMNDSMDTFAFTPIPSLCDICTLEPTVVNGSTDWDAATTYIINDTVIATCNDSFLFDLLNSTQTLACTETGWEASLPCYEACIDPPPEAGSNMTRDNFTDNVIGTTLNYYCEPGLIFPLSEDHPDIATTMTITCGQNNTWEPEDFNLTMCSSYCKGDPLPAPEGGNSSWNGIDRTTGAQVNLSCPLDSLMGDGNQSKILTCEENGNWTYEDPALLVCRFPVTEPLPELPSGMAIEGFPAGGLVWEGLELNYTCPNNTMAASGVTYFPVVYNGTSWTEIDPDFVCLNVCNAEPFTPVGKVKYNYTGIPVEGQVIDYYCESGRFYDYESSYFSVCEKGQWTLTSVPWCVETTPGPSTLPPIVLETDPPYDVSYLATAECHYPNILNNMTDVEGNPADYETPTGPFGFRSALRLQSSSQECVKTIEKCPSDAMDLLTGFSIGLWAKVIISADKFGEDVTLTDDDKQYILSTGGDDDCHTGIALYMKGDMLGGVVSVGGKVYAVEVNGAIPNNTWTNIGLRFEPGPQTLDSSGIVNDKTGGLELLVDMVTMAHVVFPQDCTDNGELDPSELMIGCHRTKGNSQYRNFINGEFDELAIWPRKLYNNETLYFAGGYKYHLEHIKGEEFLKQLDRVDLADVNQLLASVSISVSLATAPKSESTAPSATPTTGSSSSTGTASSQATASSPTSTAAASTVTTITEEEKENYVAMEILEKLTDTTTTPKVITPAQCIKMMDIAELASNLLQEDQAGTCKNIPMDTKPLGVMVADDLEYWLDKVFRSVTFDNGSEPLNILKSSPNILIQGSKRLIENWQENTKFYQIKKNLNNCNGHADQAAASTYMFSDPRCGERILSLTFTYYKTLQMCFPPVVNEALLYARGGYRIESRVVAIRADVDTKLNEFGILDPTSPTCDPEDELLKEHPNRFRLCHNTQSKPRAKRSLQFHSDNPLPEVNERFCAWWNPDIRDYGAWDTSDCKVLETNEHYTKCACAHFGRFTIIAEKTELREVPDEEIWLTVTKYVGYIASFIALLIYIIIILVSGDLKDMFHLIGLNLAFSVFFGSIFMLVSDMDSIRDDRHTCTAIGTIIHIFYLGAGAWMFVLGHSSFKAITSGVISGRMRPYFFLAWSVPLLSVGLTYLLFMQDLGLDPRCFISWENRAKYVFFGPQLFFCVVAFVFGTIVLCNLSTPALRKDNLIEEYGSFCQGASFVLMFFSVTWIFGLFAYVRFYFKEPDFYPIFQVFNSWTGFIIFMFIGLASKRFRMVIAGQAKLRRQNLFGNAFGTPPVPVDDEEYLGSPADQRSKSSSLPSSGRTSPASPSDINVNRPASSDGPFTRSQVAGRPGSRPNSAF